MSERSENEKKYPQRGFYLFFLFKCKYLLHVYFTGPTDDKEMAPRDNAKQDE